MRPLMTPDILAGCRLSRRPSSTQSNCYRPASHGEARTAAMLSSPPFKVRFGAFNSGRWVCKPTTQSRDLGDRLLGMLEMTND